ncbi:MAG TPA: CBS domain-containing protein [bacterium]|jgi:CBS domain-containing protein
MKLVDILDDKGRDVITARPEATVLEAVQTLVRHNIGALAVVDREGKLVGMFSERDVLRLSNRTSPPDFSGMRLSEHMTSDLITAQCQTGVEEALSIMTERRIRHLPVLTGGVLRGIVSQGDLVKAMLADARHEAQQLTNVVTGKYPA